MHELPGSSPLSFVRGVAPQQQQQQQFQTQQAPSIEPVEASETNAERIYRDAANFCEVAAPAALGSAVVFAFHAMQVAGGSIVAIGVYQFYLAAQIAGSKRKLVTAIVGAGVTTGMIFSAAEPIGEWQQQSEAKNGITTGIKEIRTAGKTNPYLPLECLPPLALSIIIFCLVLKLKGGRK